jgi:hypothetical protein
MAVAAFNNDLQPAVRVAAIPVQSVPIIALFIIAAPGNVIRPVRIQVPVAAVLDSALRGAAVATNRVSIVALLRCFAPPVSADSGKLCLAG